ncbi:leucyl-tRNA synthetase [Filimonas lacunae]|uniref:Leucine--tRNA ligase n=1 Tax=Filimonas lacunae TaxID=477680 RepID=A0A173MNR6_9BACT|nr:leucine--tRNA ligase [Filimonas lacunae]BAV09136.1 leucyl-tRNA synthetase [Filimonas lacunae]SIS67797.1 leucyl-tRNA synthetase [Filimonas lacunae]
MEYDFRKIEQHWQDYWKQTNAYKVANNSEKPKYYVLDMFPYPSGAGLHVGHPLGYISSDIYARFKRLKGFNVLHPMGYDAFGLPAEQYAIEHGVHPAVSTDKNIATFRKQLDNIGFCFDWDREVRTSDVSYYKWTQWIFLQLFNSFYNRVSNKAENISVLAASFEKEGNSVHPFPSAQYKLANGKATFTAADWKAFDEATQQGILMEYRLSFCGYGEVNWCEGLGTVLANDEVINGVSERGGFPVVKKKLRQWYLRITEYADRLLEGLERVDYSDAMKEMQTNWIGKSYGAEIDFAVSSEAVTADLTLTVYTTRPDTIFGVDFMVVAPEHELIEQITTAGQKQAVEEYIAYVKSRSDRERMAEKKISGCFTGAYVINPFSGKKVPVWISEYVLAGYGTGAIMAVPCGDERDFKFAQHFNIPVTNIIGDAFDGNEANATKDALLQNSDFLNGVGMREAMAIVIDKLVEMGIGKRKVNFKMRDAAFSRQRYWGEPFPVKWINGVAYPLSENELPLELPFIEKYGPGPEGEGPLANVPAWTERHLETNTMPGYAGSSWYFLRYMDPHNNETFCDRKVSDYWGQVDVYIGGTEHAVGHLLYSRMWTKILFDLGHIGHDEPYKRLVNQGMIQGSSRFVYRVRGTNQYVSGGLADQYETDRLHVDVNIVDGVELDTAAFKQWKPEFADATFILEDGKYICSSEVEKMSKSKFNTVNPDVLVEKYGADTFRMYEMFLGPVEQSKPWDTKGIEGVHRFLRKLWRLFFDEVKGKVWTDEKATDAELKVLHKAIQKIEKDTEAFSFNTAVSAFMVCVNELSDLKCNKKEILQHVLVLLTPYAPHIAEQLWSELGNAGSVLDAAYPVFEEKYVTESTKEYPVSINGKLRTTIHIDLNASQAEVEAIVFANEVVQKWVDGQPVKKFVFVKGKMVNVVI